MRVLAGDIGGTSARLAMAEADLEGVRLLHYRRYASRDYPGLAPIVRAFLADAAQVAGVAGLAAVPDRACFGIACPVMGDVCELTNLSWRLDARVLAAELGIERLHLINDLHAVGLALRRLGPGDMVTLQAGEPEARGVTAVIGAGTGLGQAYLTWSGEGYDVHASEGGHASFSAHSELEWGLVQWLAGGLGHVSAERVLSGPGLVNIYRYLAASASAPERAGVRAGMASGDPAAVISGHALAGTDQLSALALEAFVSIYGSQAGDLALTVLATGGIYLAGGIAPRITPLLRDGRFMTAFRAKGRMAEVLARVPVHVITNPHAGLVGAAAMAMHL